MKYWKSAGLLLGLLSGNAMADGQWGVGVAAIWQDQGYKNISSTTTVVPAVVYQSDDILWMGPQFSYKFAQTNDLEFRAHAQFRFDGFDADEDVLFEGMEDRDGALDLGISMRYNTEIGNFTATFLNDVTGTHKGHEISAEYSYPMRIKGHMITPFVSTSYLSDDLVDYYFGIRQNEVRTDRAFYLGDATMNVRAGVNTLWSVAESQQIIANLSYTAYGSEIKDSPLVDGSGNLSLLVGYVYLF